jgi:hypothetical protein
VKNPDLSDVSRSDLIEKQVAGGVEDDLTGSAYNILVADGESGDYGQRWSVNYLSRGGDLFQSRALAITSRVLWRSFDGANSVLPTSGWIKICSDHLLTLQDGYRLITHRFDKSLTAANQNDIEIARAAEVSLVTDVGCGTGGAVNVSGFVFGVSDTEPPLSAEPVPAHRFEIELNRSGEVLRKTLTPTEFVLPAVCASPKKELTQFCTEAKRAVGW